jgi:porin
MVRVPRIVGISVLLLLAPLAFAADTTSPAAVPDTPLRHDTTEDGVSADEERASPPAWLLGSWGGKRLALEEAGVTFEVLLTTDIVTNTLGGVRRGTVVLGNVDLTLELETKKLQWWPSGTFFLYLLGDVGGNPTTFVGDLQGTNNIEAPDTFKVFEVWYEHRFVQDRVSLRVGLHNYNAEFYVLEYATTFLNSSFGNGPELAQTGPSTFPTTALAARVKYQFLPSAYLLAAVYDGVPGNPANPRGTHIIVQKNDGLLYAVELGSTPAAEPPAARYYKLAVGAWYHSTDFEDLQGRPRSHNSGLYALGEIALVQEQDPAQGLGTFVQLGYAASDRNPIAWYLGGGLTYTGLVPDRDRDVLGLAVAHARSSKALRRVQPGGDRAETTLELTYRAEVLPGVSVQPDLQYVIHPGTDPTLENALVFTLRIQAAF